MNTQTIHANFFAPRRAVWIVVVLGVAILCGCDPKDGIDQDLVNLYADLRIATVEYGQGSEASIARQNSLREYGYTAQMFADGIQHVRDNPELWKHFQQAVLDRLDTLEGAKLTLPALPLPLKNLPPPPPRGNP